MAVFILLATFLVTLFAIAWWHTTYWRRRGIPGPTPLPFFGNLLQLGDPRHPNVIKYHEWGAKYGKNYGMQKGRSNFLITRDYEMVQEIFTTKFEYFHERERVPILGDPDSQKSVHMFRARGKRWKRLRTLANPAFSVQNLKKIFPILEDSAVETIRLLEQTNQKEFDIFPFFHEYTMDTISRIALGQVESNQFKNEYTQIILDTLNGGSRFIQNIAWMFPLLAPVAAKLALLRGYLRNKGLVLLQKNVTKAVADRKKAKVKEAEDLFEDNNRDFIDFFLDAESDNIEQEVNNLYDRSNVQLVAQLNLFLIAGFDTTANTLAFTAFYLAKRPEIQDKLRSEIEEHCTSNEPTYEELHKLKYADAIMKEVLRFHPIAALALNRTAVKDVKMSNGMKIEEGTCVHIDAFGIHFDKEIWGEDADEFKPERWLEEKVPNAMLTFGGGPRICLGMRLAYIEEKLLLVHLLRRFQIKETPQTGDKPKMMSNAVLTPEHVYVQLDFNSPLIILALSLPLIGNLHQLNFARQPATLQISEWTKKYGKVFGFQKGWRNFLVISDANLVQEMMQKFEFFHERETVPIRGNVDTEPCVHVFHARGTRWCRQRQLSKLVYSTDYIKQILPHLGQCIGKTIESLKAEANNETFNIHTYFCTLTMDCTLRVLLGNEYNLDEVQEHPLNLVIFDLLIEAQQWIFELSWVLPCLSKFFSQFRLLNGRRRKRGLAQLIDWAYETFQKALTTDEISAQTCAFLIAGFGTSSSTFFHLAKSIEIQNKLRTEINEIVKNETPSYAEINQMRYLDAVIKETLRLYPVGTFAFGRRCASTTTLGNLKVDKGTHVFVDVISMHRDKQVFGDDANEFKPERWIENRDQNYTYFPFGAGPRMCIGRKLALIEIKLAVVRLLQNFKVTTTSNAPVLPTLNGNFILLPEPINVKLQLIE
ncbi:Cyp-13A10 [Aphelenchoides bicaudatus]|nr:Cyp-13A10 [Aphelenchoides bicaudatus]